ncbi:hypothetical protein E1B28_002468 [Marasmius oreades]|uniref:Uncharacterized protein n=1 Tax=Marasmius oreades TaxID=181124 RepID=A0A9P7RMP6_9AGAR|nr:uncharacterized protein E1B28_002468 [Marasmius oreades]KAG7086516.1 hypothetical protein E1B28_002468 [Marasmius oreades]
MDPALRPTIRRKSSAQNLLSSFKAPGQPASQPPSAPVNPPPSTYLPPSIPQTPTTATPTTVAREWDAQSLYSESIPTPSVGQSTSDEYLRDLIQKRILTLTYIRNIHEGRSHWFHTILISRADLDKEFNNNDMKKRTYSFAILGLSLSNVLDIHQPQDLLRTLLSLLVEYDLAKPEDLDKNRLKPTKRLFGARIKTGKRAGTGVVTEYSSSYVDTSGDASYLTTPHLPFPLDYHQTLVSLLDVLSEVYNKIAKLIGPSALPHSSQYMMGPLGLLAPHPGVSYLFSPPDPAAAAPQAAAGSESPNLNSNFGNTGFRGSALSNAGSPIPVPSQTAFIADLENGYGLGAGDSGSLSASLYEIANGGPMNYHGQGTSGSTGWSPTFGDMVLKIDGKFKVRFSVALNLGF